MTTVEEKILRCLSFQREPTNAKTISRLTRARYSSVRVTLRRMLADGKISQEAPGFYRGHDMILTDTGLMRERLELHGIQLQAPCNIEQARVSLGVANDVTLGLHRHPVNHALSYSEEWSGRQVTVTHHEKKQKVMVALMCGDDPLRFHEFLAFASWLQGRFRGILLLAWEVIQLGLNWDTAQLGLEGVKKISVQMLKDLWFNIYERNNGVMRIEAHTTRKMDLKDLLETLALFVSVVGPPEIVQK